MKKSKVNKRKLKCKSEILDARHAEKMYIMCTEHFVRTDWIAGLLHLTGKPEIEHNDEIENMFP